MIFDSQGALSLDQLTVGDIAEFNMWSYNMSVEQLNTLTCGARGDVSSWFTLQQMGTAERTTASLPYCKGEYIRVLCL